MKRAKGRTGKRSSPRSAGRSLRKPVDLAAVRDQIRNQVGNAAPGMVDSGIEEANKGHYAAMKFLFELVGLYPMAEGEEQGEGGDGLAKTLLGRLGVLETTPAPEVTSGSPRAAASPGDTVE